MYNISAQRITSWTRLISEQIEEIRDRWGGKDKREVELRRGEWRWEQWSRVKELKALKLLMHVYIFLMHVFAKKI